MHSPHQYFFGLVSKHALKDVIRQDCGGKKS